MLHETQAMKDEAALRPSAIKARIKELMDTASRRQ